MSGLQRHVPRLALEWAATHPDERWRRIEGTLCFADISGFTALAERLAQRGRQGGEELVQTLGTVFSEMLEIAGARGGSLLKFGGDALLLFFQGDDHAVQGACAAVEMRQALRAASNRRTSVGRLRLSMSVGLHTGVVDFFLVGDGHRELVLLGDAADQVVAAEGAANAGEILLSEAMAGRLPSSAVRSREDGRSLLRWRKPASPACGGLPARDWEPGLVASLVPAALGAHLSLGAPEPEHRIACMAFVCFSGTSGLIAEQGGEALAQDLQTTLAAVQRVLGEEGVTLLSVDTDRNGGKFFMAAGIPRAHEDDEGSMLRALKKIMDLSVPIQLQAGVSRGHVFAAELGTNERAAFSAMGDTTNTAARIASKTPPGTIYVHPSVLDECLTLYEVKPSAPLVMKGKRAPLVAYEVGAEIGLRGREGLDVEEFFGRERELAEIGRAIVEMQNHSGGVLTVEGESGLGKTRLLREALHRSAGERVVAIRGEPYGTNNPYRALRDPLRDLFHIERANQDSMAAALVIFIRNNAPDSEPMAALIGSILQINIEPSEEVLAIEDRFKRDVAANRLVDLMERAIDGPLILIVDDAHWLDDATADLLSRLEIACASRPWLMLVTRRPEAGGFLSKDGRKVNLNPMDDQSMRGLIEAATEAAPLRPHELQALVSRSGGNPLFATEIIKAARDVGSLDEVPLSLEAAISTRIDALDSTARRILRYASVLGRSFSVQILENLLDVEGYELDLVALERVAGFLTRDGEDRYQFRNGMIRDAAYSSLAYRLRSRLHSAAGATMERLAEIPDLIASDLALHFSHAGEHGKAWQWAVRAADTAREAYANAEAARLYELAIQSARHLAELDQPTIVACRVELGKALERAGREKDALNALSLALRQADSDVTKARILDRRAFIKANIGAYPGAQRDLRRGLRLVAGIRSRDAEIVRASLMSSLAQHFLVTSQAHRALKQGHIAEIAAKEAHDEASLARALMVIGDASVLIEGPGEGTEIREALAIYEKLGDLRLQACAMDSLGFGCAYAGRWEEAVSWLQSARDGYRRSGDEVSAAYMDMNLGIMRVNQNRIDEAELILTGCIRVMRSGEFEHGVASAETHLARVRTAQGAFDDAIAILNNVVDYFDGVGQTLQKLEALSYLAIALTDAGKAEDALSLLNQAERATPREWAMQLPTMLIAKASVLIALDRFEDALSQAEKGAAAARDRHMLYEEALLNNSRIEAMAALGKESAPGEKDAVHSVLLALGVQAG